MAWQLCIDNELDSTEKWMKLRRCHFMFLTIELIQYDNYITFNVLFILETIFSTNVNVIWQMEVNELLTLVYKVLSGNGPEYLTFSSAVKQIGLYDLWVLMWSHLQSPELSLRLLEVLNYGTGFPQKYDTLIHSISSKLTLKHTSSAANTINYCAILILWCLSKEWL